MLHDDLLKDARILINVGVTKPRQSSLRRAISTAYYALFHLLVSESSRRIAHTTAARRLTARAFQHERMADAAKAFAAANLPIHVSQAGGSVTPSEHLREVARTFVEIRKLRHDADYDLNRHFTKNEAIEVVEQVETAFKKWQAIRGTREADLFVLSLLLWKTWAR